MNIEKKVEDFDEIFADLDRQKSAAEKRRKVAFEKAVVHYEQKQKEYAALIEKASDEETKNILRGIAQKEREASEARAESEYEDIRARIAKMCAGLYDEKQEALELQRQKLEEDYKRRFFEMQAQNFGEQQS